MKTFAKTLLLSAAFTVSTASAVSLNKSQCVDALGESFGLEVSVANQLILETTGDTSDCILINDQFLVDGEVLQLDVEVHPNVDQTPIFKLSITSSSGEPLATTSTHFKQGEQTMQADTDLMLAQLKVYQL